MSKMWFSGFSAALFLVLLCYFLLGGTGNRKLGTACIVVLFALSGVLLVDAQLETKLVEALADVGFAICFAVMGTHVVTYKHKNRGWKSKLFVGLLLYILSVFCLAVASVHVLNAAYAVIRQ